MTHILSFISGSSLSPLMLEGGATSSDLGEGFVKVLGDMRLSEAKPSAPPADGAVASKHGMDSLVANEVDLSLPNDLGTKLLAAAGHSRPKAALLANGKQAPLDAQVQVPSVIGSDAAHSTQQAVPAALAADAGETIKMPEVSAAMRIAGEPAIKTAEEKNSPQLVQPNVDATKSALPGREKLDQPMPEPERASLLNPSMQSEPLDAEASADSIITNPTLQGETKEGGRLTALSAEAKTTADLPESVIPEVDLAKPERTIAADPAQTSATPRDGSPTSSPLMAAVETEADNTRPVDRQAAQAASPSIADKAAAELPVGRPVAGAQSEQTQPDFAQRVATAQAPQTPTAPDALPSAAVATSNPSAAVDAARASVPASAANPQDHQITAQPGQMGKELAVKIAKHSVDGQDRLTLRLDPAELGRINIRMHFDDQGSLRAVVTAESNAALDMLRRESFDLARALTDAGVRTDSQSFRFDSRGQESGHQGHRHNQPEANPHLFGDADEAFPEENEYRRVRTNGAVDLFA